ncbi:MAG: hypothetical protein AAFV47_09190 [Pseudomonadota bacterium]
MSLIGTVNQQQQTRQKQHEERLKQGNREAFGSQDGEPLTRRELEAMMDDPRYGLDETYTRAVGQLFQDSFPGDSTEVVDFSVATEKQYQHIHEPHRHYNVDEDGFTPIDDAS